MKRSIKIISAAILAVTVYSFIPVVSLYLGQEPAPYTNDQAILKLTGNEGEHFAFIVLGDTHAGMVFDDSAALKLARHINREDRFGKIPIDFVITSGDISFRGSEWDYRAFNKIRSSLKWPVICGIGNHDKDGRGAENFKKYIGRSEAAFPDRNAYFIMIDNAENDISDEQFSKIEERLRNSSTYAHRFIIMHKGPISPYQQSWYRPELSEWSYRFMKLCERYKVDIVFTGHEHMYRELTHGGVRYLTSGGGGMITQIPASDGGFLNYLVVRIYGDYVDYEMRRIFPPLWEYLAYYMWKDLFYFLKGVIF